MWLGAELIGHSSSVFDFVTGGVNIARNTAHFACLAVMGQSSVHPCPRWHFLSSFPFLHFSVVHDLLPFQSRI